MNFDPTAIAFWTFGTALGFAVYGTQGAAIGLTLTSGISLLWDMWK